MPTALLFKQPTDEPSTDPSADPSSNPSYRPSARPTIAPTDVPTREPTDIPTDDPSKSPTIERTDNPTDYPTDDPSKLPTMEQTDNPTDNPTDYPTDYPSDYPSDYPTDDPSIRPNTDPSYRPTSKPSPYPTWFDPTQYPSIEPSEDDTAGSKLPTQMFIAPTSAPTSAPTYDYCELDDSSKYGIAFLVENGCWLSEEECSWQNEFLTEMTEKVYGPNIRLAVLQYNSQTDTIFDFEFLDDAPFEMRRDVILSEMKGLECNHDNREDTSNFLNGVTSVWRLIENDETDYQLRKLVILSYCDSSTAEYACTFSDYFDLKGIEVIIVNVGSDISQTQGECLATDLSHDLYYLRHITGDHFDSILDSIVTDLCDANGLTGLPSKAPTEEAETPRPTPRPNSRPSPKPSPKPSPRPSPRPTARPTTAIRPTSFRPTSFRPTPVRPTPRPIAQEPTRVQRPPTAYPPHEQPPHLPPHSPPHTAPTPTQPSPAPQPTYPTLKPSKAPISEKDMPCFVPDAHEFDSCVNVCGGGGLGLEEESGWIIELDEFEYLADLDVTIFIYRVGFRQPGLFICICVLYIFNLFVANVCNKYVMCFDLNVI